MDIIEKVKKTWKQRFDCEIPSEFVTRLECGLSKVENNPGDKTINLFAYAKSESKSYLKELNTKIRNEEFFFELISSLGEQIEAKPVRKESVRGDQSNKLSLNVSPVYAKVNKPTKSKQTESEAQIDETPVSENSPVMLSPNTDESLEGYEEIDVKNAKVESIKSKGKNMRGSVKAKIKMFERSDSSSGEDGTPPPEGEYARLVVKPPALPPISPKPSPASRRRPRANEYEEIALPCLQSSKSDDQSLSCIHSTESTSNTDKCSSDSNTQAGTASKQETHRQDNSSTQDTDGQGGKLNTSHAAGQGKKPAPPVPLRRCRGGTNEHINIDDSNALAKTEQLTLQYSEHEPKLATSRKPQCTNSQKSHKDDDDIHRGIDNSEENIEGDYCAISDLSKPGNEGEHDKNSVERKSSKNITVINIKSLSKSHENLNQAVSDSGGLERSASISKSLEEFKQDDDDDDDEDDDYSHLDYSTTFKPPLPKCGKSEDMKKLFGKKDSGSISSNTDVQSGHADPVVGKRYKSLSGSGSEEDMESTVQVNLADLIASKTAGSMPDNEDSPELSDGDVIDKYRNMSKADKRHQRVPDYEKWNFQHLLTHVGVSVAENENFTDTGSEDDTMYDNVPDALEYKEVVAGQSDDSGMCETPDDSQRSYTDVDLEEGMSVDHGTMKSTSTADSRISSASCVTVDGDAVFLQRCDSNEVTTGPIAEDDAVSICSMDDTLDGGREDLEETLKADTVPHYQSEQYRMRHLVVKGILESEKAYLHVIDQLVKAKHYLQSAAMKQGPGVIALEDVTTIFYKLENFYVIHKTFIDALESSVRSWSDEIQIAQAVKQLVVFFKEYEEYVSNYPHAVETIRKYQKNEDTRHLLEEQMDSFKEEALKLEDVLLKPVQRIQTNHLVLHDLIKHTPESHPDFKVLQKALKLSEENLRMYNAHPANFSVDKKQEGSQLVKSGFLVEVSRDKKMTRHLRYVFLFTDVLICTKHKGSAKHRDVYFKYIWSLPIATLNMHKKGDPSKYQQKESLDDLKNKIGNLKVELREEMLKADEHNDRALSFSQKRAAKNVEKLKKKIQEQEATLVEALPRLPLNVESEGCRPHTFLFSTDYEREEWREALESQRNKCHGLAPAQPSTHDCEVMINNTKLHTSVNGIGIVLLKKDEDMLTGNLNVTIHKMQGLDYPCDVYCCMEMDSYGHFNKKAQTRTSHLDTDALWNEDFELELDGSQTLRILCYKKTKDTETDVVIGKCALELSLSWLNSKFNEKTISMNDISITISIRHTPASKTLKRTHSKLKTGIFGVKIDTLCRRENKTVPSIVTACIQQVESRGMSEVGIYRVSGVTSDIQNLKKVFDKNTVAASSQAEHVDIHTVTGVLKLYFRELPEPLFTDNLYQSFIQTHQLQNEDTKEKVMLELLHSLPDANYYTVVFIVEHLVRIAKQANENKMSLSNLATIFGPTLMHPAMKDTNIDPMVQMAKAAKDAGMQTEIVYYFLKLAAGGKCIRKSATL